MTNDYERTITIPVEGMTCSGCAREVEEAVTGLPGIGAVTVLPAAAKAIVRYDEQQTSFEAIRAAITGAGFEVPATPETAPIAPATAMPRGLLIGFALAFVLILAVVVFGEWFGVLDALNEQVPWPVWLGALIVGGYPIFRGVVQAALRGKVTAHAVMTLGMLAAIAVGEWATAVIVVFFMRTGGYVESFTAERARQTVKQLTRQVPQTARIDRDGQEVTVPVDDVRVGDLVVVRPGEQIPVDGLVVGGQASVNQAAITGESMPVEAGPGARVMAATLISSGSLRVRATQVGSDSTYGRIIRLVEEAEAHKADVQRLADRWSAYFLPFVVLIAALTYGLSGNILATVAVLVVACSCALALATPIAMLASIGAAARNGLLVKGGKYLETLAHADVVLLDKTGTLTTGRPHVTDVVPLGELGADEVLALAAAAERDSEHPLAEAVRATARAKGVACEAAQDFRAVPGYGVRARVGDRLIEVGNSRLVPHGIDHPAVAELEAQGKSLVYVACDGQVIGLIAATDMVRSEAWASLDLLRALGFHHIEMLTGDHERAAAALAGPLGIRHQAGLLPEDKIGIVKAYQQQGHRVVMVGDGINDAPALAQADVGIAMGAVGNDTAIEAGHLVLMREDLTLVPQAVRIARRTMGVVKLNLGFTVVFNFAGLSLAALGLLPPTLAAAAQAVPDLGMLANSSRLLRQP